MGGGTKVVVFGMSTEGYALAHQMAMKGAHVSLIDESASSAISLGTEIAKTYPNVAALKEDEPLLPMEPIDVAISKAKYLFFAPRIRKTGQDTKIEINSKFKEAVQHMKKNSSFVCSIPTGFGGNSENLSLLEHVTGFEAGRSVNYFYYPLWDIRSPEVIGSFDGKADEVLAELLSDEREKKRFVNLAPAEYSHAVDVLGQFSDMCSVLEVCKCAKDKIAKADLALGRFSDIFLDDMIDGMYDLKSLGSSFEGTSTMTYLINGSAKSIDGYVKKLIDEIRATLKKHELKTNRTKIALSWTLDQHEMRGDKFEMLQTITTKLRDYIGDVSAYEEQAGDLFHSDKMTIVVSCSKKDYDNMARNAVEGGMIMIKANPLCETVQQQQ